MAQLAIKGHLTRGKEVIQLLEMLGGVNAFHVLGTEYGLVCYIDDKNNIFQMQINDYNPCSNYTIFTLEEFLEKFPYKVGDKVYNIIHNENQTITEVAWDFQEDVVVYQTNNNEYLFVNYLQPYKEQETIDKTKFPYEIGTRVSVKGTHFDKLATIVGLSYNSCACMQYEIQFDGEDVVVHYPTNLMTPIITEQSMEDKKIPKTYEEVNRYLLENRVKNAQNLLDIEKCLENDGMKLPENITIHSKGIGSIDFIKWYENKQYPKDYEECKALLHQEKLICL